MDPKFEDYPFKIRPLSEEEGGGFLITWPDLPGCMSDGETPEEAIEHGRDAFLCWMAAAREWGKPVPRASQHAIDEHFSGKFVSRVPKSLHARLVKRANAEGVSLNTLVVSLIAEGLGKRSSRTSRRAAPPGATDWNKVRVMRDQDIDLSEHPQWTAEEMAEAQPRRGRGPQRAPRR